VDGQDLHGVVAIAGINTAPVTRGHVIWPPDSPPEITLYHKFSTAGFAAAQQGERVLDQQEQLRLLYVGMTRAADHLVISLYHHPPGHGTPDTHAMRLSHLLATLREAGAGYEPAAAAVPARPSEPAAAAVSASEVPAETRRLFRTAREELLKSLLKRLPTTATGLVGDAAEQSEEPPDPLEAPATGPAGSTAARSAGGGAALGSTVHRALEILDLGETTDQAVNRAVTAACAELRVPHLAGEVRSRVQAALTAQIIQLAATRRHWKEVPIVAELGGRVVEGFIDLVVDTDEGLVIVDYKTDSARSAADIETKVHHYTPQIRAYAQALALATGRKVATPQILFCRPAGVTAVNVP
jgi:ATP-dependent helicase/nuclease subunit A